MFEHYVPIGDSMTIDFYAASDAHSKGHTHLNQVGAASLLFANNKSVFPEFAGKDLVSLYPGIKFADLSFDGATIESLLDHEFMAKLAHYEHSKNLITLTVGGNDMLEALNAFDSKRIKSLEESLSKIEKNFEKLLSTFKKVCPKSTIIVTTLYDPTDDTGIMPCARELLCEFDVKFLTRFNQFVRDSTIDHGFSIAEVYQHFMGHGAMCGHEDNFWYWKTHPIEPGLTGASEIRRVWLDVIHSLDFHPTSKSL